MIDLKALREQLRLLGHDLPDAQVVAILKEMNIDFSDVPDGAHEEGESQAAGRGNKPSEGPLRTGSILDGFEAKAQHRGGFSDAAAAEPADNTAQPSQGFRYDYTSPAKEGLVRLSKSHISDLQAPKAGGAQGEGSNDDSESDLSDEDDPELFCRYCNSATHGTHPELYGYSTGRGGQCTHSHGTKGRPPGFAPASPQAGTKSQPAGVASGPLLRNPETAGLTDMLEQIRLGAPGAHMEKVSRTSAAAPTVRPASTYGARDQLHRPNGSRSSAAAGRFSTTEALEDGETDVNLSDPDKDPIGFVGSRHGLPHKPPHPAWMGPGVSLGLEEEHDDKAADLHLRGPYAGWPGMAGMPVDAYRGVQGPARSQISPQASNRSVVSYASTRTSTSSKARVKKVDRVQRYQQLQQEWSQSRFLKQGGGTSHGTHRKPVNFHNHFASLHAAEEAERQRMLREARARTKKELGSATEAPTANRRDELRWQTRMRLKEQT